MNEDYRIIWIRKIASDFLSLPPSVVDNFLEEENNVQLLQLFLSKEHETAEHEHRPKIIFFFSGQVEEEVEVDVTTLSQEANDSDGEDEEEEDGENLECASSSEEGEDEEEEVEEDGTSSGTGDEGTEFKTSTPVSSYEEDLASTYLDYTSSYLSTGKELSEFTGSVAEMDKESTFSTETKNESKLSIEEPKKKIVKQVISKTVLCMSLSNLTNWTEGQPVLFIYRLSEESVSNATTLDEASSSMNEAFQVGYLNQFLFHALKETASKMFLPLAEQLSIESADLRHVKNHCEELAGGIGNFDSYLEGVRDNFVPLSLEELQDLGIGENQAAPASLEDIVEKWHSKINTLLTEPFQVEKCSVSEIETAWRNHCTKCHLLAECIEKAVVPEVEAVLLQGPEKPHLSRFKNAFGSFLDHIRMLKTTVEVFGILTMAVSVFGAQTSVLEDDVMGDVIEALFLLSFFSKFFHSDSEVLHQLIQEVSCLVYQKVLSGINTDAFISQTISAIQSKLVDAKEFIVRWKKVSYTVYDRLLNMLGSSHWKFPIEKFFLTSDYVFNILEEINSAVQMALEVGQLSLENQEPSLSSEEGKQHQHTVASELLSIFSEAEFDIFDPDNREQWRKVWKHFVSECRALESQLKGNAKLEVKKECTTRSEDQNRLDSVQKLMVFQSLRLEENGLLKADTTLEGVLKHFTEEVSQLLSYHSSEKYVQPSYAGFPERSSLAYWYEAHFFLISNGLASLKLLPAATDSPFWNEANGFYLNFSSELRTTIMEAKNFKNLGFQLSEFTLTVTLMEDHLFNSETELRGLLEDFQEIQQNFTQLQLSVIEPIFDKIQPVFEEGCRNYTWTSLSLPSYVARLKQVIAQTEPVVFKLKLVFEDLDSCVAEFEKYAERFIQKPEDSWKICKTSSEWESDKLVTSGTGFLVSCQKQTAQHLLRLEDLLYGSRTGQHPQLCHFYGHWERKLLDSLLLTIQSNLSTLLQLLNGQQTLFKVSAQLVDENIVIEPSVFDIYSTVMGKLHAVVHCSQQFLHWKPSTCRFPRDVQECTSFYDQISRDSELNSLCVQIERTLSEKLGAVLMQLTVFQRFFFLWSATGQSQKTSSRSSVKMPAALCTSCSYSDQLQFLHGLQFEVSEISRKLNLGFLVLSLEQLLQDIGNFVHVFIMDVGNKLALHLNNTLEELHRDMTDLEMGISIVPKSKTDLEKLIRTISNISKTTDSVEAKLQTAGEHTHTLNLYKIMSQNETTSRISTLQKKWQHLLFAARQLTFVLQG